MNQPWHCADCDSAKDKLEAYVDRELTDTEMVEVRKHLSDCSDCDHLFDFQEQVKMLVRRKGCTEKAPSELISKILNTLQQSNRRLSRD
jgi:mycothiol system anti-sigma-R factor